MTNFVNQYPGTSPLFRKNNRLKEPIKNYRKNLLVKCDCFPKIEIVKNNEQLQYVCHTGVIVKSSLVVFYKQTLQLSWVDFI